MHGNLPAPAAAAINQTPAFGSDSGTTPTSESEDWDWFAPVAWAVLGTKDAGQILHYITGYPVSTCRAYVAKERDSRRPPTQHFLRKLFHSPQGKPFVLAFMAGCPWWLELQLECRVGAAAIREVNKRE